MRARGLELDQAWYQIGALPRRPVPQRCALDCLCVPARRTRSCAIHGLVRPSEYMLIGFVRCWGVVMRSRLQRERAHTEWYQNRVKIVVATIAFGMGINKPDGTSCACVFSVSLFFCIFLPRVPSSIACKLTRITGFTPNFQRKHMFASFASFHCATRL
jgi:hypothetical protein